MNLENLKVPVWRTLNWVPKTAIFCWNWHVSKIRNLLKMVTQPDAPWKNLICRSNSQTHTHNSRTRSGWKKDLQQWTRYSLTIDVKTNAYVSMNCWCWINQEHQGEVQLDSEFTHEHMLELNTWICMRKSIVNKKDNVVVWLLSLGLTCLNRTWFISMTQPTNLYEQISLSNLTELSDSE